MEFFNEVWNSVDSAARKGLCIGLAVVMLFSTGYITGAMTNISGTTDSEQSGESVQVDASVNTTTTTAAPQTTTAVPSTTVPAPVESTTADAQTTTATPSTGAPATTEEIVALFNEAANKVKTEGTKVVKNFENRDFYDDQSVIPAGLDSLASSLMNQYLGDDTEPIEYATKEDIIANYPVPEQSYSSMLTAADVAEATCNDNGSEYEITLNLATSVNPVSGVGVGAACDVLESSQITSNGAVSKILKEFTITYSGCVIKCKIDKATNRLTWASYYTPLTIDALVSVVVSTVDAKVVLSFEKDYTVTY